LKELFFHKDTPDTKKAIMGMTKGYYSKYFWIGILLGNMLPLLVMQTVPTYAPFAGVMTLLGIYLTEFVRIRVPQMIPLS
jgi:hypothetical protein